MKLYKIFSIGEFLAFGFFLAGALLFALLHLNNSSINDKGIRALKNKDFLTAQKYFKQNVESGFLDNRSYLNLGLSYDFLKQPLKALEIYKIVSHANNKSIGAFFSYFNQAELHGRLGDLNKSLINYQSALDFGKKEKEIKTNIELLFKQKDQKGGQGSKSERSEDKEQSNSSGNSSSEQNKEENQSSKDKEKGADKKQALENKEKDQQDTNEESQSKKNTKRQQTEQKKEEDQDDSADQQPKREQNKNQQETGNESQSERVEKHSQKALTDREQKAILEEVQKQENKVRTRFYQNKRAFGDKTEKDW